MLRYRTAYRVIYGDTDQMGVAYYANYLRWFEMGRTEMFRRLGVTYGEIEAQGIALPVLEAFCKYHQPARYDDVIVVETILDPAVRAGMKFDYRVFRESDGGAGTGESGGDRPFPSNPVPKTGRVAGAPLLAEGYTRHACLNRKGRVVRPPAFLTEAIAAAKARHAAAAGSAEGESSFKKRERSAISKAQS
ncbi:MAG: acyl-CoA thioesterase [Desulfococcaceae bacterium]